MEKKHSSTERKSRGSYLHLISLEISSFTKELS